MPRSLSLADVTAKLFVLAETTLAADGTVVHHVRTVRLPGAMPLSEFALENPKACLGASKVKKEKGERREKRAETTETSSKESTSRQSHFTSHKLGQTRVERQAQKGDIVFLRKSASQAVVIVSVLLIGTTTSHWPGKNTIRIRI